MTVLPHDFPPAREMAEAMAREWHTVSNLAPFSWDTLSPGQQQHWIDAHLHLLCDLTRHASRDAWVRWGIHAEGVLTQKAPASPANDHRQDTIVFRWMVLRDDAATLALAVLAVTAK